jgi:hypothetical protein
VKKSEYRTGMMDHILSTCDTLFVTIDSSQLKEEYMNRHQNSYWHGKYGILPHEHITREGYKQNERQAEGV